MASSEPSCYSRFWSSALRSKPLVLQSGNSDAEGGLVRRLSLFDLVLIGIGASIGAGIFVVTGTVAHDAGPGQWIDLLCVCVCVSTIDIYLFVCFLFLVNQVSGLPVILFLVFPPVLIALLAISEWDASIM